jgi:hypothetical protein
MRPPRFMQSRDFWFAVSLMALAFVSVWLFLANRDLTLENKRDIEAVCNTTTTLDIAVVVPLLVEVREAVKNVPPGEARADLIRLRDNLRVAHEELSMTEACDPVR